MARSSSVIDDSVAGVLPSSRWRFDVIRTCGAAGPTNAQVKVIVASSRPERVDADVVGAGVERPLDAEVGVARAVVVLHDARTSCVEERADGVKVAARLHHGRLSGRHHEAEVVRVVPRIDGARGRAREGDAGGR